MTSLLHRSRATLLIAALTSAVLLGTLTPFAATAATPTPTPTAPPSGSPTPTHSATPTPTATPTASPTATTVPTTPATTPPVVAPALVAPVRTCSIASTLRHPSVQYVNANVSLASTDERLLGRGVDEIAPSGSTMKLITAIAAYHVLGPNYEIRTYLYPGDKPGSFIVKGAGDPTLRSGWWNVYWNAPTLISFSNAARAYGATSVSFDPWLYQGANWHPGWNPAERADGNMAPMEGFMLDGGRVNPGEFGSTRQAQPAWDAGVRFAQLTGVPLDPTLRVKPGSDPVGVVASAPMSTLVKQMLQESDNVLAEAIGRQIALKLGYSATWWNVNPALTQVMRTLGLDVRGIDASDASGLARWSRTSPAFMDSALRLLQHNVSGTHAIIGLLPRNQVSGTLAYRLGGIVPNFVAAKTGWVDYGYSMAGFMWAPDGQLLRFTFTAWKDMSGAYVTGSTRSALDAMVTATWRCGANLSNT